MRKILISTLFAIVAIVAATLVWRVNQQRDSEAIRNFIERRYASEILRLETTMLGLQRDQLEDYSAHNASALELEPVFNAPEIFEVGWSDDGHHGARSIKPMPTGFSTHRPFFFSPDWSQTHHHLFFGKSFDGEPLLIYEGWLPRALIKRDYKIVFYGNKLCALMDSSK